MKKLDSKGNVAILFCIIIVMISGIAAYVIDVGLVFAEKIKLSNAIDSAVLAASMELPEDTEKARNVAINYLEKNNVNPEETTIAIGSDHKSIEVRGKRKVKHLFAQVFGIDNSDVTAGTEAIVAPAKSVKGGIRPFAVEKFDYSYGDLVTLKEGAGDGYHGNYGVVALGGSGSNVFKINTLYGYDGTMSIGDIIPTEPGNMSGTSNEIINYIGSEQSSFDNFDRDSIRLWTIPLVDTLVLDGRKGVEVVGFGEFYVESVVKKSGKIEFNGRFIRYVTKGEADTGIADTGLYVRKLVK